MNITVGISYRNTEGERLGYSYGFGPIEAQSCRIHVRPDLKTKPPTTIDNAYKVAREHSFGWSLDWDEQEALRKLLLGKPCPFEAPEGTYSTYSKGQVLSESDLSEIEDDLFELNMSGSEIEEEIKSLQLRILDRLLDEHRKSVMEGVEKQNFAIHVRITPEDTDVDYAHLVLPASVASQLGRALILASQAGVQTDGLSV